MKARFVIPWYGENIPGGAELACRVIAENLQQRGADVEVLTTCARDAYSWENNHRPGNVKINNVSVKRFKIDKRNNKEFDFVNSKLMNNIQISKEEENIFIKEMINSKPLYDYIADNNDSYYFFIPYMFGTTFYGLKIHPHLSYLIPCLHDESYAHLKIFGDMFKVPKGLIFLSKAEEKLATEIYDINKKEKYLFGTGLDTDIKFDAYRFRNKYKMDDDFILYVGRKEVGKNVNLLLDYFSSYKKSFESNNLKLVLLGSGNFEVLKRSRKDIIDLGFVPVEDKYDAYSAALMHCQPSVNESFSFTIMESWLCETPVLVHENCAVTKKHCLNSSGGLFFNDIFSFMESINYLKTNSDTRNKMALNGKKYVKENFSWDIISQKYLNLINSYEN